MKETKCVIEKSRGKFTREKGSLRIECDLVKGVVNCELIGNYLVHIAYEDIIQERILELLSPLVELQSLTESEEE